MTKYRINKGYIIQKIGNKTTIFDSEKSALYNFNETATFIFEKLKKNWQEEKIAVKLSQIYNTDHKTAQRDVSEIISGLLKKKILIYLPKPKTPNK